MPPAARVIEYAHRGSLFRKYLLLILSLVTAALLASGGISLYFSYQENRSAIASLQNEKAVAAASRIEQYVLQISRQLAHTVLPQLDAANIDTRRIEFLKLLRQAPEVTDIAQLDASGREQIAVSRLAMDVAASGRDRSAEPAFRGAKRGQPWYGPVYFRRESEPYITIALRGGGDKGPVTVAEVNLKFIWDVVTRIKIGDKGKAYVVDAGGFLVADPDIGLVLRKTSLGELAHVKAAATVHDRDVPAMLSHDLAGTPVLTSMAPVAPLQWKVFVEQPIAEVYAKLNASIVRTLLLLLAGLGVSAFAALALARGMTRPIRTLDEGARRIGAGDLEQQIVVRTGDELEGLADQFNRMTAQLRESYAGLERKVEQRTAELTESLDYQTAISSVLRVISGSPTDVAPVFEVILDCLTRLFGNPIASVHRFSGGLIHLSASRNWSPEALELARTAYPAPPDQRLVSGRVILTGKAQSVEDIQADPGFDQRFAIEGRWRRIAGAPMLKDGAPIGVILLAWPDPGRTPERQMDLFKTFADQAAIAIENVRLFQELQARTRELARSVEELQALGEVGRAVSSTLDVETVLTTIVARALELSGADAGVISEYDEPTQQFHLRTAYGVEEELVELIRAAPIRLAEGTMGKAAATRVPVQVADILNEREYDVVRLRGVMARLGYRSLISVPLLREERIIGGLAVWRRQAGEFPPGVVNLLQTFATQSTLAIQNARLFREIEEKSRELELANQHKSEFLANMSHELRTPLNAIIGFSELLIERLFGELNDKQDEYLKDIHSSGKHLLSLINDILDLSKIEAGRMELDLSAFDAPSALADAMTLVRERATRHGIALGLDVAPQIGEIRADERKFKQILLNLLSNAVKFTPDGGRVDVRATLADGDMIEVAVSDTGIGIAKEDQQVVFEEFRQVGRHYTNKQEGTGLGLALTKRFVELHGGTLRVESEPGQGSTFSFRLPVRPAS